MYGDRLEVGFSIPSLPSVASKTLVESREPGKASRTLVESSGLPSDSTCVLEADPSKLDIKRRERGTLYKLVHSSN